MTRRQVAFAVPGDINVPTGGNIYDRRLIAGLRAIGHDVQHITLPSSFPDPTDADATQAIAQLDAVHKDTPLIIDGLAFGALATSDLSQIQAPLIALIHHPLAMESGLDPALRDHLLRTERDNLKLAQQVIVPSPHTAQILQTDYRVPPKKLTIARPGIDQPQRRKTPSPRPLILSVGLQAPRKGHDVLLKALAQIKDSDWDAIIVGMALDKGYAQNLTELTETLELNKRVTFAGKVSDETLQDLYQQASVFALATRYEGYGIVFDEALTHGLPIVSCATGAVVDTVPASAGILVPPDAPAPFAEALRQLLENPEKRDAMAHAADHAGQRLLEWDNTAGIVSGVVTAVGNAP